MTLGDTLAKYKTLTSKRFVVRMEPAEADLYGQRVLILLESAAEKLSSRYGVALDKRIFVEIFPRQADFAIRTFGLPGGGGYLGVCFGPVITVNSPASRMAHPANWEAVLWHEFCHSVTLAKTRNKMPRWLSEGISVYEERRENPGWGQSMTPQYRQHILDGQATPVSQLSGAFLRPPSPMHLRFAYYESSMVVAYIAERFGFDAINRVLSDLGDSVPINVALARHTEPLEALDAHFADWLKKQAEAMGPEATWTQPDLPLDADSATMSRWTTEHPDNFWGQLGLGRALLAERKFAAAKAPLKKAAQLWPAAAPAGGPYLLLAAVHRELGESADETAMLKKHVALDADAFEPRLRLAELCAASSDWPAVDRYAAEAIAINPLVPAPYRLLASAAEATGDPRRVHLGARRAGVAGPGRRCGPSLSPGQIAGRRRPAYRGAPAGAAGAGRGAAVPPGVRAAAGNRGQSAASHRAGRSCTAGGSAMKRGRLVMVSVALCLAVATVAGLVMAQQRYGGRRNRGDGITEVTDRRGVPDWEVDPNFKSDVFTFVRVRYQSWGRYGGGWETDFPDADLNLCFRLQQMTSLKVDPTPRIVSLTDEKLFDYPFIYIVEPGGLEFTDEEVVALRRYLNNGGFSHVRRLLGRSRVGKPGPRAQARLSRSRSAGAAA